MNIGIIVNFLQGGGAERCAADLSIAFSGYGHDVIIFTDLSYERTYEYKGTLVNFTFTSNNADRCMSEKESILRKAEELGALKSKYGIDIAISFMQFANYINILSKGKEKTVLTTHSVNSEYAKYDKSVFWSDDTFRNLYQFADYITFPSEYCRKDWIKHYGDKNNITRTIYNPVHVMQVDRKDGKENMVIAIGRMHSIKRQWHIIRAFKMVKEKCPDSKLIILGEGELRPRLEKLLTDLQLEDDVEMPGNVTNVNDYLERAKVFTITSHCEAMPCAVLEAMSAGVPVVACDIPGGIREEIGIEAHVNISAPIYGECGIMVPYIKDFYTDELSKEEMMLADEICILLRDDELREQMGQKAQQRADEFSLDKIGAVWADEIMDCEDRRDIDAGSFAAAKKRGLDSFDRIEGRRAEMYMSYYRLLEKWMLLHENGKSIKSYFEKNGLKNIIIYGMGKMTHHLLADLKDSNVNVVCAIDRGAINKNTDFPIISDEDDIPDADCIVITPVYDEETIRKSLENKTQILILSLLDIVNEC